MLVEDLVPTGSSRIGASGVGFVEFQAGIFTFFLFFFF